MLVKVRDEEGRREKREGKGERGEGRREKGEGRREKGKRRGERICSRHSLIRVVSGGGFLSLPIELLVHLSICCNWFQMSRGHWNPVDGGRGKREADQSWSRRRRRENSWQRSGKEGGREATGLEGFEDGCGVYSLCCYVTCLILIVTTTFSHIN